MFVSYCASYFKHALALHKLVLIDNQRRGLEQSATRNVPAVPRVQQPSGFQQGHSIVSGLGSFTRSTKRVMEWKGNFEGFRNTHPIIPGIGGDDIKFAVNKEGSAACKDLDTVEESKQRCLTLTRFEIDDSPSIQGQDLAAEIPASYGLQPKDIAFQDLGATAYSPNRPNTGEDISFVHVDEATRPCNYSIEDMETGFPARDGAQSINIACEDLHLTASAYCSKKASPTEGIKPENYSWSTVDGAASPCKTSIQDLGSVISAGNAAGSKNACENLHTTDPPSKFEVHCTVPG